MKTPKTTEIYGTRDLEGKPDVCAVLALLAIGHALERIADRMEAEGINDSTSHVVYRRREESEPPF